MTLYNFLKMYKGNAVITVYANNELVVEELELDYDSIEDAYDLDQEYWLDEIKNTCVIEYQIIGGGLDSVELIIKTK